MAEHESLGGFTMYNQGFFGGNCCWIIIAIILICCCCGGNNNQCGCGCSSAPSCPAERRTVSEHKLKAARPRRWRKRFFDRKIGMVCCRHIMPIFAGAKRKEKSRRFGISSLKIRDHTGILY